MLITIQCSANMGGTSNAIKLLNKDERTLIITLDDITEVFKRFYEKFELHDNLRNVQVMNMTNRTVLVSVIQYFIHGTDFDTLVIDNFNSLFTLKDREMIKEWMNQLCTSPKRCIIVEHTYAKIKVA